ncbi:LIM domain-containing protein C4F6.12 [Colletotrichum tanaceti]|uniref:LIM domain-containing protein C4F6.12 n=1 Tax=Colletotrichum tanaceti TaxID=1306861 RepID=A0A4U6XWA1_9PEZI|nr:LIM domain-containing protein C4F6.12 [Colletotrichum tanaceti]TKW60231.1 LIM domain-containing protein C4F6.12 [Colletotrichum tanaceti]
MHRRKSTEKTRKVSPPSPSYMNNEQFAAYLANLRTNRVARPGGARPLPPSSSSIRSKRPSYEHSVSEPLPRIESAPQSSPSSIDAPSRPNPSSVNTSFSSRYSMSSTQGRDYYPYRPTSPLKPSEVVPTATYMERGQRWMEKEEVASLRQAMDDMQVNKDMPDPKIEVAHTKDGPANTPDDDTRIYSAALDEASELVWQHQNGVRPPDPHAPYRYKPHLRKDSYAHARTASVGKCGDNTVPFGLSRDKSRSVSGSSTESDGHSRPSLALSRDSFKGQSRSPERSSMDSGILGTSGTSRPLPKPLSSGRRRSSMKRNISGEVERPFSGDQIWEEPEQTKPVSLSDLPLVDKPKNPQGQVHVAAAFSADRIAPWKPKCNVEIHRNPPSQSRNPLYTTNSSVSKPVVGDGTVPKKNGMEIRSDDIRGATSMKLKDRSAKLPTPTAVSDRPGRPIVSFDSKWKAPDEKADAQPGSAFGDNTSRASGQKSQPMEIPSIVVAPEEAPSDRARRVPPIPSITIDGANEPAGPTPSMSVVVTSDVHSSVSAPRPLPDPKTASRARPFQRPQRHWSPAAMSGNRSTTLCHECGFPIEGRFVSLAGLSERFHPQCFSCYACGTGLEALEISPEPEAHRKERLERICRRANGEALEETPGKTMAEDGDERLRFFCHLDWHELFAPKCKHCKTPILGEHVVALGEHWHYGHFFCAECGDPFEKGMTHIEKDGYAWCISCQTKRTERRAPKCKNCKTAVIGQYVRALGGEWHDECFRCASCQGGFEDGQIFPKEVGDKTVVLCTGCRMMELKA